MTQKNLTMVKPIFQTIIVGGEDIVYEVKRSIYWLEAFSGIDGDNLSFSIFMS